jgi:hypothetical protein
MTSRKRKRQLSARVGTAERLDRKNTSRKFRVAHVCSSLFGSINLSVSELLLEFLAPIDLVLVGTASRYFATLTRAMPCNVTEGATSWWLWTKHCSTLWENKVYVPWRFATSPSLQSYFGSIKDSKRMFFESVDELAAQHFHFRFRRQAGPYWCNKDSSFRRIDPRPLYRCFLKGGGVSGFQQNNKSGNEDGCRNSELASMSAKHDFLYDDPEVQAFIPTIKWRFTKSRYGKKGQFIKINNWPSLEISRRKDDWGWELSQEWVKYRTCCAASVSCCDEWLLDPALEFDSDDEEFDAEQDIFW